MVSSTFELLKACLMCLLLLPHITYIRELCEQLVSCFFFLCLQTFNISAIQAFSLCPPHTAIAGQCSTLRLKIQELHVRGRRNLADISGAPKKYHEGLTDVVQNTGIFALCRKAKNG